MPGYIRGSTHVPRDAVVNTPKSLEKYGRMLGTIQYSILREEVKLYG